MMIAIDLLYSMLMVCLFCVATYISVLAYRSKQYRDAIIVELCAIACLVIAYLTLRGIV